MFAIIFRRRYARLEPVAAPAAPVEEEDMETLDIADPDRDALRWTMHSSELPIADAPIFRDPSAS